MKLVIQKIWSLMAMLCLSISASAYDFSVDGIYYNITDAEQQTVAVTSKSKSSCVYNGEIAVPSEVQYNSKTYSVTSIGEYAFGDCSGLTSVTIPNSVTSIGNYAFYRCSGLTSVIIGKSVTYIGLHAFYGCSGLTSVTIPNSITSISSSTFSNCSSLTSVTIPNSVTSIGAYAFRDCWSLTSVTIPNSVTSIDDRAFYGCRDLQQLTLEDGNLLLEFGESVFDSTPINVAYIGRNWRCSYGSIGPITSVTLGNQVTALPNSAFSHCSGLTSITIPNSVTSIGKYAFYGCSGLTSFAIPNSVTSIGESAFYGCSGLTSFIIPNSVTSIGEDAFNKCYRLKKAAYPSTIQNPFEYGSYIYNYGVKYDPNGAIIEDGFIYGPEKSSVLFVPYSLSGEYTIANSVTSIGNFAFYDCSSLTSVTIPNSVISIGNNAFDGCTGLKDVITQATEAPSIDYSTFFGVYSEATLFIPKNSINSYLASNWMLFDSLKFIGEEGSVNTYSDGLLSYYILPVESEDERRTAFVKKGDYKNLTSVVIPERFTDDNSNRYYITGIGYDAFNGCTALKEVKFSKNCTISTIGENAFTRTAITSIEFPSTVTSIGNSSFYDCSGLTSITLPTSVTSIGSSAFYGCRSLTSVTIPNSVTSIDDNVFDGCTGLTSITIPNSVTSIGAYAFSGCSGLTSVTIPNSVTFIGNTAFSGCSSLTSVNIPNSVTSIRGSVFSGCSGLKSITLPNSVTSIGEDAFANCFKLTEFIIEDGDSLITIDSNAIASAPITNIVLGRNWTYSGSGAISTKIKSVTLGKKVTQLPENAFKGCGNLTSVTIPNSVTSVGGWAFADCYSLTSVTLGNSIDSISESAFANCKLTEVVLPPSVETIGRSAFAGNSNLNKIAMGCKVKTIDENAYQGANADSIFITAQVPPKAPISTFSRYAGTLFVQGNAAVDAYYDATSCWDRFEGYAMSEPQSLTMEKPKFVEAIAGVQFTLKATLTPANVDLPYVFWRSTDPEKAYVDKDGKVTVLQNISAYDNVDIIAETLYYNGPTAKFTFATDASGVGEIVGDTTATMDVFTLQGVQVLRNATREQFDNLTRGIYIVKNGNGVKKVVK